MRRWTKVKSEVGYTSEYFRVYTDTVALPSGSNINYDWFAAPDFCVVVPALDEKLVMIRNYRYPADEWCLEFPAGHLNRGEQPEEAAKRELLEETGYTVTTLTRALWYYPSSRSTQRAYVFLARLGKRSRTKREESELQRVVNVTPAYLERKIKEGGVVHAATLVAYSVYTLFSKP